jgi:hypothetical protein
MTNPLVVEKLVRILQEEVQREIEHYRLLKALPKRQPASLMQVVKSLSQAFKVRAPKARVSTARKAGAAEC